MVSTPKNDFSKGSVRRSILRLAIPMTLAQLINVLYNVVDRIYIGHMPEASMQALTGIGLALPVITIITAFANLFSMGGSPLFSMARGGGDSQRAKEIMGNTFAMLLLTGAVLAVVCFAFQRPLLYLLGASDETFPFASSYLSIYLIGTLFVMVSLGMNPFINAQGFGVVGMLTVSIGAVLNLILDPLFIFGMNMGIRGAAFATVLSQLVSAAWVLRFLTGKKVLISLSLSSMKLQFGLIKEIIILGLSGFIMYITNASVQIVCNATLQNWGGDVYISVMTLINSVREVVSMPVTGTMQASQPVMSFNYGAKNYDRVKTAIRFVTIFCISISLAVWGLVFIFPEFFIRIFNSDPTLIQYGVPALHVYFFGFFLMALQISGQTVFQALGKSKQAIFFSLFRKVIIVIPLTVLLPMVGGLGTTGVFMAEPISNLIGGGACFTTMMLTVWRKLGKEKV
jgi:putative MATE family efflux protein